METDRTFTGARFQAVAVLAVLGAIVVIPFWVGRFLPLIDMPQHLGIAAIIARVGDAASPMARYYTIDPWPTPYWAYYAIMWLFSHSMSIEIANKVVLSLYAVGLPLSVAYVLRGFNRDWRWAVFALPLVFSTVLFWGFAPFLVSMPFFFLALGLSERNLARERVDIGLGAALAAAALAVFFGHAQTYLLLGLAILVLLPIHWRGFQWAASRSWPYLPSFALFSIWACRSFIAPPPQFERAGFAWYGHFGNLGVQYEPYAQRLLRIVPNIFGSFSDRSDERLGMAYLALLGLAIVFSRAWSIRMPGRVDVQSWRFRLRAHRNEALTAVFVATYLALPYAIKGAWWIAPRYLSFAVLLAPLLIARPATGRMRWFVGAAAVLAIAVSGNTAMKVREYQHSTNGLAEVLDAAPSGNRMAGFVFDEGSPAPVRLPGYDLDKPEPLYLEMFPLHHAAAYYQALRGGDVGVSFVGLPSIPVVYRAGMQAPFPSEDALQTFDFDTMGPHYQLFLVRGKARGLAASFPEYSRVLRSSGTWELRAWSR